MAVAQPTLETGRANGVARVVVVIVNYRTPELTGRCLASLEPEKRHLPNLQVLVVDGGSGDGSAERLGPVIKASRYRDWVSFMPLEINGGFGWANNAAISSLLRESHPPEFIHLLNPDCEIEPNAVSLLLAYLQDHHNAAAVGSQLLNPDGSYAGSAFTFPTIIGEFSRGARTSLIDRLFGVPPVSISATEPTDVEWATGASVMVRAAALKQVGLFDEGFFLYHDETELMWRLRRAGWTIAFEPRSKVRHVGGASTGVNSRVLTQGLQPPMPAYWYRSRSRFLALTQGRSVAMLAYAMWIAGYFFWSLRRALGLAPHARPCVRQLRDHIRHALPRASDTVPAAPAWDDRRPATPAWMERGW